MKRLDLVRHLHRQGCVQVREGHDHTIYENPANNQIAPVGRHREIAPVLVAKICKQLGIPKP